MHKKIKRDLKFFISLILINFSLYFISYYTLRGLSYRDEILYIFTIFSVVLMATLFIDTVVSISNDENRDSNLLDGDCFYAKSEIQINNLEKQKVRKNSIAKTILKYIFYAILVVVIIIVVIVSILVSILYSLPPGTDM